jgi:group I intron endonuclease
MRKHGIANFDVVVLESNVPDEQASQKEREYISKFNTSYADGCGYNVDLGGRGNVGYAFTDEARQKISNSMKGHVFPESRNLKIKAAMTGREYKQEWRDALSKSRLGRFTKDENPFYGKHHSEATKSVIGSKNTKYHVLQLDPNTLEIIQIFKNANAAGKWVVEQGLTSAQPDTCAGRIGEVCRLGSLKHTAYTYKWQFKEKSID